MENFIKINVNDNVVVALNSLTEGYVSNKFNFTLKSNIDMGHKVAVCDIKPGDDIIKYGAKIGTAKTNIIKGETVHTHNIQTALGDIKDYTYNPNLKEITINTDTFKGFLRQNGKVGVRNEIWVIPTVGCMNSVAVAIANKANQFVKGSVEKVIAFTHPYGCSQMGEDENNTRKILANLATHPNAGGVLLLGLGCENCGIDTIKPFLNDYDSERLKFLIAQDYEDEVECSLKLIKDLIEVVSQDKRTDYPMEKLVVGLKCGGSDGLSGITANPTVGVFSDILIKNGGTSILTEVPEMFGAETLLLNRCKNDLVFSKAVNMVNGFKEYFKSHNQVIYENPSPGNKKGGISTLEDKSLGCTQKSGTCNVQDVLEYGEKVKENGLNLLYAPGNDLVASTALASSGAQIILFTTGRGTPFASPVPTLKISSNTSLKNKKSNWIDFDCGEITQGESIEKIAENLYEKVKNIANGELVKSEQNGYYDMAIFKQGVTL